jgi:hypothetical protein
MKINRPFKKLLNILSISCLALFLLSGCGGRVTRDTSPVTVISESLSSPRNIKLKHMIIDLTSPGVEIKTAIAEDPDGKGPAQALLTPPVLLASKTNADYLINCSAFSDKIPGQNKYGIWIPGRMVKFLGLAASNGKIINPPHKDYYTSIWTDKFGKIHFGTPNNLSDIQDGFAGFSWLIKDGKITDNNNGKAHPRTAIGIEKGKQILHILIVDGRESGVSEGMTRSELALQMKKYNCYQAVNLDGGGSTCLLAKRREGNYKLLNRPSTRVLGLPVSRPLPIALAIIIKNPESRIEN